MGSYSYSNVYSSVHRVHKAEFSSSFGSTQMPQKYVTIDGIRRLNPAFINHQKSLGQAATTALDTAGLMVVSSMEECRERQKDVPSDKMVLASSVEATVEMMQQAEYYQKVGLAPGNVVTELGKVFTKYEAPVGLMNKLTVLSEFDALQFIIDDSGSMGCRSDVRDQLGRYQSRWEEVQIRLKEMLEVLAYVPTPRIEIRFLNRSMTVVLERNGESPEKFLEHAYRELTTAFMRPPSGSTPIKECLEQSFSQGAGRRVARYLFCDGEPDGGESAKAKIADMVKNRPDPQGNPMTFLSCTDQDDQVEWMKETEELAPYCAEYDDFHDEAQEVRRDQGNALPFTKGFYLIAQLIGVMNPDDLDAMDESVPLTKWTLDNLLGIELTENEYRYYFNQFKEAQRTRKIQDKADAIKSRFDWEPYFHEFKIQHASKNIEAAKRFREELKGISPVSKVWNVFNSHFSQLFV